MERELMNFNYLNEVIRSKQANIIVLGSGLEAVDGDNTRISHDGKMRLHASSILYEILKSCGLNPKVIVCGGTIYSGYEPLSVKSKRYLINTTRINEEDILIVGGTSTLDDINKAIKICRNEGGVVISNVYHHTAEKYASKKDLGFISAEELLSLESPRYEKIIEKMLESDWYGLEFEKQIKLAKVLGLPFGLGEVVYNLLSLTKKRMSKLERWDREKVNKMIKNVKN